jgi:hypothetical protein
MGDREPFHPPPPLLSPTSAAAFAHTPPVVLLVRDMCAMQKLCMATSLRTSIEDVARALFLRHSEVEGKKETPCKTKSTEFIKQGDVVNPARGQVKTGTFLRHLHDNPLCVVKLLGRRVALAPSRLLAHLVPFRSSFIQLSLSFESSKRVSLYYTIRVRF